LPFNGVRLEYALEGSSNYVTWMEVVEDNGLKEFIDNDIPKAVADDAQNSRYWKKCAAKVRWIILEGVRDHIVSNVHGKDTLYEMWQAMNFFS